MSFAFWARAAAQTGNDIGAVVVAVERPDVGRARGETRVL
jgi:crotonobetainyl-CoA:carnitine CoA-transferase CaiB-like acyl-CoA transferase